MNSARKLKHGLTLTMALAAVGATAQVPDLLNALDSGGRALGLGGATRVTDGNTYSALDNPAGLANVAGRSYGVSFRNLPESTTRVSGDFDNRTYSTDASVGKTTLTHVGTTFDLGGGTVGVSYTVGGFVNDTATGNNLDQSGLSVRNLQEQTRAQTDFFAVSYGKRMNNLNVGYGLVIANQYARATQSYQLFNGNTQVGTTDSDLSGNGIGVGVVLGVQGEMADQEIPMVWGASVRTPIDLMNNGSSAAVYDRIPGKLSAGLAGRLDNVGSTEEFLSWAFQTDYYFGGQKDKLIPRKDVLAFGAGVEYNLYRFNARIPVRLGYQFVPSGGAGFGDRNAFTFGVGYRPYSSDFSLDLNLAKSDSGSGFDMALGVTYRPSN